jgi:hypothetical protein
MGWYLVKHSDYFIFLLFIGLLKSFHSAPQDDNRHCILGVISFSDLELFKVYEKPVKSVYVA